MDSLYGNSVTTVPPPKSKIKWTKEDNLKFQMTDIEKISFDVGNVIYDFEAITEYEVLTIFTEREDQLVAFLTQSATDGLP